MGIEDLLKQYMAAKNPYGTFGAGASPATTPAVAGAPPVAPMGPAPSMNTHAPVVPGGSFTSALLNPMGAAQQAAQTPEGSAALLASALDPVGTVKAGGVNMDELKQGMADVATRDKQAAATADQERLKAAGLAQQEDAAGAAAPRAQAPTVIPGGWMSTISPEARREVEAAFAKMGEAGKLSPEQLEAAKEQTLAERELNNRVAQGAADVAGQELGRAQAETAKAELGRQAVDKTNQQLAQVNAEIDSSQEDPGRFWKNAGGLGSAMIGIGAALGAFGEAFAGVKNRTFEMVDQAIARDIAAQRAEIGKKTGQRDTLLKRLAEQTGSIERAEQLADYAMRQSIINRVQAQVGSAKDGAIKARGDALLADLTGQQKQREAALAMQQADFDMKTQAYRAPQVIGGGGGGAADKQSALMFEAPDGSRYIAKDAKARDELAIKSAAVLKIKRLAEDLNKVRDSASTYVPGTENAAKAQALGSQFLLAVKDAEQLGAITKSDLDTVGGITGDPTSLFSRAGQKSVGYAQALDQGFKDRLKAEAVEQVQTGYKVTPQGQLAPAAAYTGKSPTKTDMPGSFKPAGK